MNQYENIYTEKEKKDMIEIIEKGVGNGILRGVTFISLVIIMGLSLYWGFTFLL